MLGYFIRSFLIIAIGITLHPIIRDEVMSANFSSNATGSMATIVDIVPVLFILAIILTAIGSVTSGLRSSGLIGRSEEEDSEYDLDEEDEEEDEGETTIYDEAVKIDEKKLKDLPQIELKEEDIVRSKYD